jgi:hypothetical protein
MDIKDTKICFSSSINLNEPKVPLLKKATLEDMWEQWGVKKKSDGLIPEAELRATPSSELNTALIWLYNDNQIIEQEYGLDWGIDMVSIGAQRDQIETELRRRGWFQNKTPQIKTWDVKQDEDHSIGK